MRKKPVLYKVLVVGVIALFIGVGIQPAFAMSNNSYDDNDDCDICPKLSKQHIVRIKSLLDRLEKYDNELSVLSKLNPDIEEKYQEISIYINSDEPISIRPLCIFLEILMSLFLEIADEIVEQLSVWMPGDPGFLYYIIPIIACLSIAIMFQLVGVGILCWKII